MSVPAFALPWFLVLGVVAAAIFVAFSAASARRSRGAALAYSDLAFLERAVGKSPPWTAIFAGLWAIAIVFAGAALAKPSIVTTVPVHDAAVVLCIDTSGSMAASDISPTRSAASSTAAQTFVDGVPAGTRIGILAFSNVVLPLGPLTDDRDAAREEIAHLPAPNGGTAIGDALAVAARMLPPAGRRAIVLVTDGVNNTGGDPLATATALGAQGISIFTVGIGTNGSGMTIPGTNENAELDEDALQSIARSAHGTYARVGDAGALSEKLGALAKTSIRERRRFDLSFECAVIAGVLALGAALAALTLGRFP